MAGESRLKRRSTIVWLTLFALGSVAAVPLYIAVGAFRLERSGFLNQQRAPRLATDAFGIPGLTDVGFRSRSSGMLRGVFVPPKNGSTIVLLHGAGGERSDLADEARILAGAGFGVLAYDSPGHGQSEGGIVWGEPERQALASAVDFVARQPGVDASRLGGFGFSMGGYVLTQQASRDARLRAVVIAASPHDAIEHTRWEYRRLGFLRQAPALFAIEISGMPTHELVPVAVIGKIAPRPLLLVRGDEDEHVPAWVTERLWQAAHEPKQLLVVKGAGHGGYAEADPVGYARALVEFFSGLNGAVAQSASSTPAP